MVTSVQSNTAVLDSSNIQAGVTVSMSAVGAVRGGERAVPQPRNVVGLVGRVMQQSDDLVVVFEYSAADGTTTRRVVSPIRFLDKNRFLGLCLSREEPRQFHISRCRNVRVDLAMNYVMPVEMVELGGE